MVFPDDVVVLPDPAVANDLADGPTFKDKLVAQLGPYKPVVEALQAHGLTLPTRTLAKTGAYTMVPGDGTVLADATAGAFDVTLPPHLDGRVVRVEKVDASDNVVTVLPGSGVIAGGADDPLEVRWHGAAYQSDGTNWTVVARTVPPDTYVPASGTAALTDRTSSSNIAIRVKPDDAGLWVSTDADANDANDGLSGGSAKATIAGALAAMGTSRKGRIHLLHGAHDVGPTLGLTGYQCGIEGIGDGVEIVASAQTGPVLDFTGYVPPSNAHDKRRALANVLVRGDGTAGSAKKGILLPSLTALVFENISVRDTGGIPLDLIFTQLCDFYGITLNQPVSANANNIPYARLRGGTTGNRFFGLGLRSITTDPEGAGGCVRLEDDGVDAPHYNDFLAPWLEHLHLPTGGSIFQIQGNLNIIDSPQWFDCGKVASATGTACVRFLVTSGAPVAEQGGNEVRGVIPGASGGVSIDRGVYMAQSRNVARGIKGYNGGNVEYAAGVQGCHTTFEGQESGGIGTGSPAGVVDNSGNYENGWHDYVFGEMVDGPRAVRRNSNGALEVSRRDGGAPGIDFGGSAGARMFVTTANSRFFLRGGRHQFQNVSGISLAEIQDTPDTTEGNTALVLGRKSSGVFAAVQVSFGVADSGGAGFRVLRIPN